MNDDPLSVVDYFRLAPLAKAPIPDGTRINVFAYALSHEGHTIKLIVAPRSMKRIRTGLRIWVSKPTWVLTPESMLKANTSVIFNCINPSDCPLELTVWFVNLGPQVTYVLHEQLIAQLAFGSGRTALAVEILDESRRPRPRP